MTTKFVVIGASGFIGRALHAKCSSSYFSFFSSKSDSNYFSIYDKSSWHGLLEDSPETILIVSWPGLPNYNNHFHITRNLSLMVELIDYLINAGIKKIVGLGTCYEYGNASGELFECHLANPNTCYGIAKDAVRKYLQLACEANGVGWVWLRIFYPYGLGQNPKSLYPSLLSAIDKGDSCFSMSSGTQIRDFIHINDLIEQILAIMLHPKSYGIYNCGSGNPISIFDFAKSIVDQHGAKVSLKRYVFPDRSDEPFASWASISRYLALADSSHD